MFECVSIELNLANCRYLIIACVYRLPGSDVILLCDNTDRLFNQVAIKKTIFICGDFNIDLFKHDSHSATKYFLHLMFSLGIYPVINKPTRISNVLATLIDHKWFTCYRHKRSFSRVLLFVSMTVTDVAVVALQDTNVKQVWKMLML